MTKQKLNIGLFGFGCVGQGLYDVLEKTPSFNAEIKKICIKDPNKSRSLPASRFTFDKNELLNDESIDVIVELIDNAEDAFSIVSTALTKGKAVVTANKKMLAEHFTTLYRLQQEYKAPLLYEAAVCGAIPVIRTLEEYYDNELLTSVEGIFNGTTNYILSNLSNGDQSYDAVLKKAQEAGFAESDPTLDVQAYDPKFKLGILIAHAFGVVVRPEELLNYGVHHISADDINYANEKGFRFKLVARAYKEDEHLHGYVLPKLVSKTDPLYNVNQEFNAVSVKAAFSDKQFFSGRGAGSHPTAAAVLSDLAALRYDYRYAYKKINAKGKPAFNNDAWIYVYVRFSEEYTLNDIGLFDIRERFIGSVYQYAIGKVRIADLLSADLNNQNHIFIADATELVQQSEDKKVVERAGSVASQIIAGVF